MGEHANLHARSPSRKRVAAWGFVCAGLALFLLFAAGEALAICFRIKEAGIVENIGLSIYVWK